MADDSRIEKIEAWLSGNMPPEAANEFSRQMQEDPALAEEVELHRLTLQAMQRLSENKLRNKVSDWLENVPIEYPPDDPPGKPRAFRKKWVWIALLALLFLATGVFGIFKWKAAGDATKQTEIETLRKRLEAREMELFDLKQQSLPPAANLDSLQQEIQALQERINALEGGNSKKGVRPIAMDNAYYEAPYLIKLREIRDGSPQGTADSLYNEAIDAFRASNFEKTASLCNAVLVLNPSESKAIRLLAHAQFRMKHYIEAMQRFEQLAGPQQPSSYRDEAQWNILLCHKALSSVDARERSIYLEQLKKIAESNSKYREKAKNLLKMEE